MPTQAGDTPDSIAARKRDLRASLKRLRQALSPARRRHAAMVAARHLLRSRLLKRSRHVAVYLTHGNEIDTAPLLRELHRREVAVYVPITLPARQLCFVRLRPGTKLRRGRFGVRQPSRQRPRRNARNLHMILLPLLGFDASGRRLGYGGGYYDRALAGTGRHRLPQRIGYAFAAQQVAFIPTDSTDQALDAVVTERGLRRFY